MAASWERQQRYQLSAWERAGTCTLLLPATPLLQMTKQVNACGRGPSQHLRCQALPYACNCTRSTRMGGMQADRSAKQGADSVLWPWLHWQPQLAGSFTRDGGELPW